MHERFFSSYEFSYEKCSEIFPEFFEPLFCGSEQVPGKFPPNFPLHFPNFPANKSKKKSPTSFCRSAGRTKFASPRFSARELPRFALRIAGPSKIKCPSLCCFWILGGTSHQLATLSRAKNQPKEEVFGTDVPRTSGGHSRGCPGPKLRSGRSKSWKNKHLGADIHDPKARTYTTLRDFQKLRSEKLWGLNFRPHTLSTLVAPYGAILRYYRYDIPCGAIHFLRIRDAGMTMLA